MTPRFRSLLSALIAFGFYFIWTYWANNRPEIPADVTLRAAWVQASYSACVTLVFTLLLEKSVERLGAHCLPLVFLVPRIPSRRRLEEIPIRDALEVSDDATNTCIPGAVLAPLLPLAVQTTLVIGVNLLNRTPELWLTVAPSILFSALYGYTYTFALVHKRKKVAKET